MKKFGFNLAFCIRCEKREENRDAWFGVRLLRQGKFEGEGGAGGGEAGDGDAAAVAADQLVREKKPEPISLLKGLVVLKGRKRHGRRELEMPGPVSAI